MRRPRWRRLVLSALALSVFGYAALAALIPGACAGARATVTPVPSSHAGTLLGPAVHRTGIWAVSAWSRGRQQGESSVRPTISNGPRTAGA